MRDPRRFSPSNSAFALAMLAAICAGCAKYDAAPITNERVEQQLAAPDADTLEVAASQLQHPILKAQVLDLRQGLSPDDAAVVAVLANPSLRAERERRNIASAQLVQAGLLPNPQLSAGLDFPRGADPADSHQAYNVGVNWDITSLIGLDQRKRSAQANADSVALDVAWNEWRVAQAAKVAVYQLVSIQRQLELAQQLEQGLTETRDVMDRAVAEHLKTAVDYAAADASLQETHTILLGLRREVSDRKLALNKALGLPPSASVKLRSDISLPADVSVPAEAELIKAVENRRLDLLALKKGYESQDATFRAAVLAQFPKINVGGSAARDTSNVKTTGVGITIDLPIFDQNQAIIAEQRATREKLFDEYVQRVFESRSDIATALADIEAVGAEIKAIEAALPVLERLEANYKLAVDARSADVLSYYTTRTTVVQRKMDAIKLRQELAELTSALEIASGQYLQLAPGRTP
jgi:cobalt-zinc-cadmium efflux system outer membrane protein